MQKYKATEEETKMKSRNLKAMLLGVAFAASLTFAGTQPQMPFAPLLEVHAAAYQDVELDSKYDFEKAFQKALDVARDSKDKNTIYRIKIPAGTLLKPAAALMYTATPILIWKARIYPFCKSFFFRNAVGHKADLPFV